MVNVSTEQVISDLKELFKINDFSFGRMSIISKNKFLIHKQEYERFKVIEMLNDYFAEKIIEGGYLEVDPMTLIYTTFEIVKN